MKKMRWVIICKYVRIALVCVIQSIIMYGMYYSRMYVLPVVLLLLSILYYSRKAQHKKNYYVLYRTFWAILMKYEYCTTDPYRPVS